MGRSMLLLVFVMAALLKMINPAATETNETIVVQKSGATIIYLVRHAEKITTNPKDEDPGLTTAGRKRAQDLKLFLRREPIAAFFSTPYQRNQLTVKPIARGKKIEVYDAHDYDNLKNRIMRDYRGKTVLVVGHSNTLLPTIEALGGKKPMEQITDSQYDNLFKITVLSAGNVHVEALKFGARSI